MKPSVYFFISALLLSFALFSFCAALFCCISLDYSCKFLLICCGVNILVAYLDGLLKLCYDAYGTRDDILPL